MRHLFSKRKTIFTEHVHKCESSFRRFLQHWLYMKSKLFFLLKNFSVVLRHKDIQTYWVFFSCVHCHKKKNLIYVQRGTIAYIHANKSGSSGFSLPFFNAPIHRYSSLTYCHIPIVRQLLSWISLMDIFFFSSCLCIFWQTSNTDNTGLCLREKLFFYFIFVKAKKLRCEIIKYIHKKSSI